ncbi:CDP-alcohol phosphatidyltransferase family protein [Candidatus Omnitrophota bacterium]
MPLTFANKISIFRIISVPLFIASVMYYSPERDFLRFVSLGIFLVAIITDVIDGHVARTRRQKTKAGAILDPIADKLLLISAFICLYLVEGFPGQVRFPLWLVLIVTSRDAIILLGSGIIFLVQGHMEIAPTRWGKTTTFFQTLCIVGMLLQWSFSSYAWYLTVFFTVISGLGYIKRGFKILNVADDKGTIRYTT